jgi:hypothetical protein
MNRKNSYCAGDLVLARKIDGHHSPHWEWIMGVDYPEEYAVITKVEPTLQGYSQYHVKYIDGRDEVLSVEDLRLLAFGQANGKISRDDAPVALNEG